VSEKEPAEARELREVLLRLPGICEVQVQPVSLEGLDVSDLSLAPLADLPAAALRRTGGGLAGESVIQVWIRVERSDASWTTLEFLGWYVRDSCRAGEVAQMRVRGLPPRVGDHVQVGTTLLFVLEWFVIHPQGDVESLLARIGAEAKSLALFMRNYGDLIGADRDDPRA
jgi:hypothetical protein